MAITTSLAPSYGWRMIFIGVLCAAFGAWGGYDLWVKIPKQEQRFGLYEALKNDLTKLEELRAEHQQRGTRPSPEETSAYDRTTAALNAITPGGVPPVKPGKWDRLTCWFFIACLPAAPYFVWLYSRAKRQKYTLADDDTLQFEGDPVHGSGAWPAAQIADIDMSRWMAKSIAHAVHVDGTRLKLDAYLHKNLHLIIGAIAARLHPADWDAEAKPVKAAPEDAPEGASPASASSEAP